MVYQSRCAFAGRLPALNSMIRLKALKPSVFLLLQPDFLHSTPFEPFGRLEKEVKQCRSPADKKIDRTFAPAMLIFIRAHQQPFL
ncbi:MAG: hypothetical protein ABSF90_30240 [Syntrophobacteraceae bacterium]